eukprot:4712132-Amphidinium_carterae.1
MFHSLSQNNLFRRGLATPLVQRGSFEFARMLQIMAYEHEVAMPLINHFIELLYLSTEVPTLACFCGWLANQLHVQHTSQLDPDFFTWSADSSINAATMPFNIVWLQLRFLCHCKLRPWRLPVPWLKWTSWPFAPLLSRQVT